MVGAGGKLGEKLGRGIAGAGARTGPDQRRISVEAAGVALAGMGERSPMAEEKPATTEFPRTVLQSSVLGLQQCIRHGFFTRHGGVSEGIYQTLNGGLGSNDAPDRVTENRRRMAATLGVLPSHLVTAYQIHSSEVVVARSPWSRQEAPRADGVVTCVPGMAVGVTTADCGPVLLADSAGGVVGAAHAGWKGALNGIIEATVAAMEQLGAKRERIAAAIGPAIRQPSYEVGPEFVARFLRDDDGNARFFAPAERPGHALFDLPGYVLARLFRARVGRIEDLGRCTYADPAMFFSFRRAAHRNEPDYGRHVSAIAIAA
jgi:YfiH family protein